MNLHPITESIKIAPSIFVTASVVRVPGYIFRGPGFDSQRYYIFSEVVGLERGPLSLVRIIEELLE
jgi:hypothetical protein